MYSIDFIMIDEKRLKEDFNEVNNLTAVCRHTISWADGEYPELKTGKTYKVTHIGVFRSRTDIMLEEFGHKDYNSCCFDLYENGVPLGNEYTRDFRFLAPYLKEMIRRSNPYHYSQQLKAGTICGHLRGIEKEHGIMVLLAIPTGSRAWGLEAENSDWDVSYLYVHKPEWYEQSEGRWHIIERVFDDNVDSHGWELKDALQCLEGGNPTILEWLDLDSPSALYLVNPPLYKRLREISKAYFNSMSAMRFYNQAYSKLNERFIQKKGNLKEFLYYLRGVLACKWIESKGTLPPMYFLRLLEGTVDDEGLRSKINKLINLKKSGKCNDDVEIDAVLIETVRKWASFYDDLAKSPIPSSNPALADELDALFKEMVMQFT